MVKMTVQTESLAARVALGDSNVQDAEVIEVAQGPHNQVVQNDKLVKIYTKIRDARKALSAKFDEEDSGLKIQLEAVATELKKRCMVAGQTGFKTEFGTVYISESMKVSCGDWSMFGAWLKDQDPLVYLESRVKSTAVKDYMDSHNGELPPGITVFRESEARVRAPEKKLKAVAEPDQAE
jgi:hypothetical protein